MNNVHLIYIPMTGVGLYGGYRGDDWYKERISVFKEYTLKSLQAQTNQNFMIWLSFRPQEETNPLTAELANFLKDQEVRYVLTFDGLMYHDDKFNDDFKSKMMNIGRVIRDCWRNPSRISDALPAIREIYINKNSTLRTRLDRSLSVLEPVFGEAPWITVTRIDSDDMFNKFAVEIIQKCEPFVGALVCKGGLIYNTETNELAEWNPPTNPPFHTIFFPNKVEVRPNHAFFDADAYLAYFKDFKSHEDVVRVFDTVPLPDYFYCVTTHNPKNHISTIWNHPFRGQKVDISLLDNFR